MRQAGILAAAALYALDQHIDRLAIDHERAHRLAVALNGFDGVRVDLEATKTNIVVADFDPAKYDVAKVTAELKEHGVLAIAFSQTKIRFVTHLDLTDDDIEKAIEVFKIVLK